MNDYCVECGGPLQIPTLDPTSGVYSHSDPGECVRVLRRQRVTLLSENAAWRKRTDQAESALSAMTALLAQRDDGIDRLNARLEEAERERDSEMQAAKHNWNRRVEAEARGYARGVADSAKLADDWCAQYPEDVFPPGGSSIEAKAAAHARRVAGFVSRDILNLLPAPSSPAEKEAKT